MAATAAGLAPGVDRAAGKPADPAEMLLEVRFSDEDTAWQAAESAGHCAWYARLVGLAEIGPLVEHYEVVEPG